MKCSVVNSEKNKLNQHSPSDQHFLFFFFAWDSKHRGRKGCYIERPRRLPAGGGRHQHRPGPREGSPWTSVSSPGGWAPGAQTGHGQQGWRRQATPGGAVPTGSQESPWGVHDAVSVPNGVGTHWWPWAWLRDWTGKPRKPGRQHLQPDNDREGELTGFGVSLQVRGWKKQASHEPLQAGGRFWWSKGRWEAEPKGQMSGQVHLWGEACMTRSLCSLAV